MATYGGKRENAGRKPGQLSDKNKSILESKALLVKMIRENEGPLFKALIDKAKTGDVPAIKETLDRGFGKVVEQVDLTTLGEKFDNGVVFYVPTKRDSNNMEA